MQATEQSQWPVFLTEAAYYPVWTHFLDKPSKGEYPAQIRTVAEFPVMQNDLAGREGLGNFPLRMHKSVYFCTSFRQSGAQGNHVGFRATAARVGANPKDTRPIFQ